MKKYVVISALTASVVFSTSAFAQAKNFEGFTAGVNISSVGGSLNLKDDSTGDNTDVGQQSVGAGIELGYNFAATNKIVLGLTATYDFVDNKLGQGSADGESFQFKGQNRYSINFKPGYAVSDSTLVYATVGYNNMKAKLSGCDADGCASVSKNVAGIGYGFGTSVLLDKNLFLKLEVQQINFNSASQDGASAKPTMTVGTVGIGYKF